MPNRKTNPLNSFFLFCQDYRKSIANTNPKLTNSEVSSQLGELWRKLDSKTKKSYVDRSRNERAVCKPYFLTKNLNILLMNIFRTLKNIIRIMLDNQEMLNLVNLPLVLKYNH